MNVPKDVYLEIVHKMSDRDVLNMLSVNKKYNNEEFFRQILVRRYPLLIAFRKYVINRDKYKEESWKALYLRMIKYIGLLKEKYNVDYIAAYNFNPKKTFYSIENFEDNFYYRKEEYILDTIYFYNGVRGVDIKDIIKIIYPIDYYIKGLAINGDIKLMEKYEYKKYNILDYMMRSKNYKVVQLAEKMAMDGEMISFDDPIYELMSGAASSDDLALAQKYVEMYKKQGKIYLRNALSATNFEIFKFVLNNTDDFFIFDTDYEFYDFIKDEKLDWVIYFLDFIDKKIKKNKKIYLDTMKECSLKYNARDILIYINKRYFDLYK